MKYVLVLAYKAANNVVIVWRLYYVDTFNRELIGTNVNKLQTSVSAMVVVDGHVCHTALNFGVKTNENQDTFPTLYWWPKLHKSKKEGKDQESIQSSTTSDWGYRPL